MATNKPRCWPGLATGGLSPAYFKVNFASETLAPDS